MIAVLISIRPKWCEKIISGEKTIEVRKTRPKMDTPFKCYIYCTQSADMLWILKERERSLHPDKIADVFKAAKCGGAYRGNGKVIGEFTCNRVTNLFSNSRFWLDEDDVLHTCLSAAEMRKYANGANGLYGWHISNLKIYDTPKELIEFHTWKKCKSCNKSGYESTACIYDENCIIPAAITKAPQSWCYVEEETWND
jgi:predicted transcriptional regulator